jgi:outer membrane immunogenic protein
MRAALFAGVIATGFATAAVAADMPAPYPVPTPPPVYTPAPEAFSWTGFYIGGNGGYGFASGSGTASVAGGPLNGLSTSSSANIQGGIAGGQAGFNWQTGSLVLGVEGDADWSGQSSTSNVGCGVGCNVAGTAAMKWFATARARVGYAFDRLMIYGTGGAAWLNANDTVSASAGGGTVNLLSASSTPIGFAIGGGVEYAITNNLFARAEYLYMQANSTLSAPIGIIGGTISDTGTIRDSIVRAGVNYRF